MKNYWVSLIVKDSENGKPWLCTPSDSALSVEKAKEMIDKYKKNYIVLSAWVDSYNEIGEKFIELHECYLDGMGGLVSISREKTELNRILESEKTFVMQRGGYSNLTEFDLKLNSIQRKKIVAFKKCYDKCYLGKINLYGCDKVNIEKAGIIVEYTGQRILDFEYDFCVKEDNEELKELIKQHNTLPYGTDSKKLIDRIFEIIGTIGITLTWV